MPTGATVARVPATDGHSGGILSPRHWKVRTKLAAVLLVPAIAFLVLASINMATQIGNARDFGMTRASSPTSSTSPSRASDMPSVSSR